MPKKKSKGFPFAGSIVIGQSALPELALQPVGELLHAVISFEDKMKL